MNEKLSVIKIGAKISNMPNNIAKNPKIPNNPISRANFSVQRYPASGRTIISTMKKVIFFFESESSDLPYMKQSP